jgi:DNA polymerase III epsilon subunit-like protein
MRKLIVVDIETTGLEDRHQPLEIAAVTMNATPFYMVFTPSSSQTASECFQKLADL